MEKNCYGFTLIELLSVITIIALISVIAVPNILKGINNKKSEINEVNSRLLETAATMYIERHPGIYSSSADADGSTYCIILQNLVNEGLITTPFKDVNGNEVDYSKFVKLTYNFEYNNFDVDSELKDSSNCSEVINYVNVPILSDGMIPIIFDSGVKKADVGSKWYSYSNKKWANAVLVKSDKIDLYKNAIPGTIIADADIVGYFVWIPRFKYQLFSSVSRSEINVVFDSVSNSSLGSSVGEWLTHPAFKSGDEELTGFWVGKYKSSNSSNNVIIKSGQTAWTNIDFSSALSKASGVTNVNSVLKYDSHLTRNSEWGALLYLANSKYGINDGIGSSSTTTGNETGVYDLIGKEYVSLDASSINDLGHALSETSSWTSNSNDFVDGSNVNLVRSGDSVFNFNKSGSSSSDTSFRVTFISK